MGIEIERKYLINTLLWDESLSHKKVYIKQAYISHTPEKTIRVRIKDNEAFITIKGKTQGCSRLEFEYPIPIIDAHELIENFTILHIEKTRYYVMVEGKLWEVDVFLAQNAGLIIAEIELTSEDEIISKPVWIAEDVSYDIRYYNSYLAEHPYVNW